MNVDELLLEQNKKHLRVVLEGYQKRIEYFEKVLSVSKDRDANEASRKFSDNIEKLCPKHLKVPLTGEEWPEAYIKLADITDYVLKKLERYEEALKFYANENHFDHLSVLFDCDADGIQREGGDFAVVDDGIIERGTVAKKALEDTK